MILPVGAGRQEGIPSPNTVRLLRRDIVPSALRSDVGPLSFQSLGHGPFICLRQAGPTTQAIRRQATIYTASTHGGVDPASSDGRKALGVDGRPIVPHQQIQWVRYKLKRVAVTTSHGRLRCRPQNQSPTDPFGLDGAR